MPEGEQQPQPRQDGTEPMTVSQEEEALAQTDAQDNADGPEVLPTGGNVTPLGARRGGRMKQKREWLNPTNAYMLVYCRKSALSTLMPPTPAMLKGAGLPAEIVRGTAPHP